MYRFFILLLLGLTNCKTASLHRDIIHVDLIPTTKKDRIAVKGENFSGTVFTKEYLLLSQRDMISRYDIDSKAVREAEFLLRNKIRKANKRGINQGINNCPIIHENLYNYFRQYVGYIDKRNHKIVHVNFYWDVYTKANREKGYSDNRLNFESDYAIVHDGCSYHWSVDVDLNSGKLFNLDVNGLA